MRKPKNANLAAARKNARDEFYTQYEDIENELKHYDLKGLKVYCNCDTEESNFVKYFENNNIECVRSSTQEGIDFI